jgi:transposase
LGGDSFNQIEGCHFAMLGAIEYLLPTELDERIFAATVPADHYLRRVAQVVDFSQCREVLAAAYCQGQGRPAVEPLLLMKLEFLEYHYNLSDRQVVGQARYNMAFRWFLGLSLDSPLPHHTLLTYFRKRLGWKKHQEVFDALVAQARAQGLVKDRLRLKDATHVIANIAIPSTIGLVSQTRQRLLTALRPWAAERVAEEEQQALVVRTATSDLANEERLLQRVVHLRSVVAWADTVLESPALVAATAAQQQPLRDALQTAHKLLSDQENPEGKQPLRSAVDPDARRVKHVGWHTGYLLDVAMDADSEIVTALNVLPGGSNEGADVTTLLAHEESVHGNDVKAVSLDGAGYQGPVLRELTQPSGPQVEVFVPPPKPRSTDLFTAERFTLDAGQTTLTCPAGQTTQTRRRCWTQHGWAYRFDRATCAACPLLTQCVRHLPQSCGRTVIKNDYEAEYRAAQAQAQTPAYAEVRRRHRAIERKLGEMVRWHRCRRARYWGRGRVLLQGIMTALVVNTKRVVALAQTLVPDPGGGGTVRAGWVG